MWPRGEGGVPPGLSPHQAASVQGSLAPHSPGSAERRGVLSRRELRSVAPLGDLRRLASCSHSSEDAQASEHVVRR